MQAKQETSEQQSPNHIKHQRTRQATARAGGLRGVRRQLLHDGAAGQDGTGVYHEHCSLPATDRGTVR